MTFDKKIYAAVTQAREDGLTTGNVVFPMLNMIASVLANTVVHNNLVAEDELETVRNQLDELYTRYSLAYRQQTTGQSIG